MNIRHMVRELFGQTAQSIFPLARELWNRYLKNIFQSNDSICRLLSHFKLYQNPFRLRYSENERLIKILKP